MVGTPNFTSLMLKCFVLMCILSSCNNTQLSAQRAFDSVADLASATQTEIAAISSTVQMKLAPQDIPYLKIFAAAIIIMIIHSVHLNIRVRKNARHSDSDNA